MPSMLVDVQPVRDGPDYVPGVTITLEQPGRQPWEPQLKVTLEMEVAADLWGQLGNALRVIEVNADPS